jgi:hypothetical protein
MKINCININKAKNHRSFQNIEHQKIARDVTLKIQILARNKYKNVAVLNRIIGSQPSLLDSCLSNGKIDISNFQLNGTENFFGLKGRPSVVRDV